MKRLIASLVIAVLANPVGAMAANGYLCVADKATGFAYDEATHQWNYARFNAAGKKHLLKNGGTEWTWADFGDPSSLSGEHCDAPNEAGYIFCRGISDIRFSMKNFRYQVIYPFGYVGGLSALAPGTEGIDTPYIEIGTCSTL